MSVPPKLIFRLHYPHSWNLIRLILDEEQNPLRNPHYWNSFWCEKLNNRKFLLKNSKQ